MNYLSKRRERVERLCRLALADRKPHKYIQGRFILAEIDRRVVQAENYRNVFLHQLRGK